MATYVARASQFFAYFDLESAGKPCGYRFGHMGSNTLAVENYGKEVVVRVSDNGAGIDARLLPHVFKLFTQEKRFFNRSKGGLGLGLRLVKSLVELHGGRVTAASEDSDRVQPLSFFSLFTGEAIGDSSSLQSTKQLTSPSSRLRLLVVDDNVDAATALAMLLEAAGHEVEVEKRHGRRLGVRS